MTEPTDEIPEFVLEKLHSYDTDQLGTITDHLLGGATRSDRDIPEDLRPILVMQDETTLEAIGETANQLAGPDDEATGPTGYEGMAQEIIEYASEQLGTDVARSVARDMDSLRLDEDGEVEEFTGNEQLAVEQLADVYMSYAGPGMKNALADIADGYDVETPVNLNKNPFG